MSLNFYFNKKKRYHYADGEKKYEFISKNKVRELVRDYLETRKADTHISTNIIPYKGLKRETSLESVILIPFIAIISKPYEGLKHLFFCSSVFTSKLSKIFIKNCYKCNLQH